MIPRPAIPKLGQRAAPLPPRAPVDGTPKAPVLPEPSVHAEILCPGCRQPMGCKEAFFADHRAADRFDEVVVYACRDCLICGVLVPGIHIAWRRDCEGIQEQLAIDALEGLRQKRFMDADEGDPIFGWGGW